MHMACDRYIGTVKKVHYKLAKCVVYSTASRMCSESNKRRHHTVLDYSRSCHHVGVGLMWCVERSSKISITKCFTCSNETSLLKTYRFSVHKWQICFHHLFLIFSLFKAEKPLTHLKYTRINHTKDFILSHSS